MREATDEPARYAAIDGLAVVPALVGVVSLLGTIAAIVVGALGAGGSNGLETAFTAGLASWLIAGGFGLLAMSMAIGQLIWVTANRRSPALPATALLLSLAVLVACAVLPFGAGVAAQVYLTSAPQPAVSTNLSAFSVALSPPWSTMGLPLRNGSVLFSDSATVTIYYQGLQGAALMAGYDQRIRAAGWTQTFTSNSPGVWSATYALTAQILSLSVFEEPNGNTTTVSMVLL